MADQPFQIGLAVGVQSAFGVINATIKGLVGGSVLTSADGIVLGDKASGDAESGITIPNLQAIVREVATVTGSFTQNADAFLRAAVEGMSIAVPMQGNGAIATPTPGEAQPLPGLDALWQISGLSGAAGGANAEYDMTPTLGTGSIYATVKLWVGDLSFTFGDCICDTTTMTYTPGGSGIAEFSMQVGAIDGQTTGVGPLGAWDYTTQATEANPSIEGVNFTWGTGHPGAPASGFETLAVTISQPIDTVGDSNVPVTGEKQAQTARIFTVDGRLYVDDSDTDFDYQNLVDTTAPTDDLSFQVGIPQTGAGTINAFKVECNNLQNKDVKYDRTGTATMAEITGAKCTAPTAGDEFRLTFN